MSNACDIPLALLAETAVEAARAGGAVLLEELGRERRVEYKGAIDLVTDADRRSEETIVSALCARFPNHQIISEEGARVAGNASYRWIVDPLDGTTNYAHCYPHFSVSIALEKDGQLAVGVVYDPVRQEMFTARAGAGAYLNGRRLRVSRTDALIRSLLSTGFPYDRRFFDRSLQRWDCFVRAAQAVRRDGSAALNLCYVAAGRFDGFWEDHLKPWDTAAGLLMVLEAGGAASSFAGHPPDLEAGEILASNRLIHDEMLAILAQTNGSAMPSR